MVILRNNVSKGIDFTRKYCWLAFLLYVFHHFYINPTLHGDRVLMTYLATLKPGLVQSLFELFHKGAPNTKIPEKFQNFNGIQVVWQNNISNSTIYSHLAEKFLFELLNLEQIPERADRNLKSLKTSFEFQWKVNMLFLTLTT